MISEESCVFVLLFAEYNILAVTVSVPAEWNLLRPIALSEWAPVNVLISKTEKHGEHTSHFHSLNFYHVKKKDLTISVKAVNGIGSNNNTMKCFK